MNTFPVLWCRNDAGSRRISPCSVKDFLIWELFPARKPTQEEEIELLIRLDTSEVDCTLLILFQLDMNGIYSFSVGLANLTDLGQEYQFPHLERAVLHVEATVSETYTGKSQTTISRKTLFASSPYVIKLARSSKYFKPGLPYILRVSYDTCTANCNTTSTSATSYTHLSNSLVLQY